MSERDAAKDSAELGPKQGHVKKTKEELLHSVSVYLFLTLNSPINIHLIFHSTTLYFIFEFSVRRTSQCN